MNKLASGVLSRFGSKFEIAGDSSATWYELIHQSWFVRVLQRGLCQKWGVNTRGPGEGEAACPHPRLPGLQEPGQPSPWDPGTPPASELQRAATQAELLVPASTHPWGHWGTRRVAEGPSHWRCGAEAGAGVPHRGSWLCIPEPVGTQVLRPLRRLRPGGAAGGGSRPHVLPLGPRRVLSPALAAARLHPAPGVPACGPRQHHPG